jgi:hypothetical protein
MPALRVAGTDLPRDRLRLGQDRVARERESVRVKARHGEKGKPYRETFNGDDLHRDSGEWRKVTRVIDRENDRYSERVVDEQGRVVREVDEPLNQHINRGAAKPQPPKQPEA